MQERWSKLSEASSILFGVDINCSKLESMLKEIELPIAIIEIKKVLRSLSIIEDEIDNEIDEYQWELCDERG